MLHSRHQPRPPTAATTALLSGALVAVLATTCLLGSAGASVARTDRAAAWEPPPHTLVAVSGSRADGFTLEQYDGTLLYPPTLSEARAECAAYAGRVRRTRCRVEVSTWYRDLGELKRSLRWAASQASAR